MSRDFAFLLGFLSVFSLLQLFFKQLDVSHGRKTAVGGFLEKIPAIAFVIGAIACAISTEIYVIQMFNGASLRSIMVTALCSLYFIVVTPVVSVVCYIIIKKQRQVIRQ